MSSQRDGWRPGTALRGEQSEREMGFVPWKLTLSPRDVQKGHDWSVTGPGQEQGRLITSKRGTEVSTEVMEPDPDAF